MARDEIVEHQERAERRPIYAEAEAHGSITGHILAPEDRRAFGCTRNGGDSISITPFQCAAFFFSSWRAAQALRSLHIKDIVARTSERRAKARCGPAQDHERMRRCTKIFAALRPWYPRDYLCLYDSLALLEFMALTELYPTWVFAVQARPFAAHCWIESDGLLLNESTEFAAQFTPILIV